MHPFGGTPICPRCEKTVYAAEQVMGPGRKLYHKPCLACTTCNKRLDSLTLLEHDQMPYCKTCHVKNFGTRDLRQANLPHRANLATSSNSASVSLPPSPVKLNGFPEARISTSPIPTPPLLSSSPTHSGRNENGTGAHGNGSSSGNNLAAPRLRPNRSLTTPTTPSFPRRDDHNSLPEEDELADEERDTVDALSDSNSSLPTTRQRPFSTSYIGYSGYSGVTRAGPLSPNRTGIPGPTPGHRSSNSGDSNYLPPTQRFSTVTLGRSNSTATATVMEREREQAAMRPLVQTSTGTRYGVALGGGVSTNGTGAKRWGLGSSTPSCPRCGKNVYFAEQVKAVGKTYHKGCLRCTECSILLDSSRLRDHDGEPICVRCYGKFHGPQGSGYGLLGKAGGG